MTKDEVIYFIKQCDRDIIEHTAHIELAREKKINLFKDLRDGCEHLKPRDDEHKICGHESLKREADAAGCNAYSSGCTPSVCPLIK